jgi:phosphomannomutase/phosphoglucomutase
VNPSVFREYDIRGVADRDLPDELARDIGRALGATLAAEGKQKVALGRDCRLSSPRLHAAMTDGLLSAGRTILDVGIVATPVLYFAVHHLDADGGVMITGSHNPAEDNGFKLLSGKATIYGEDIQAIRRRIEAGDFGAAGRGSVSSVDVEPAYVARSKGDVRLARTDLRVILDGGNGSAGPIALACVRALGIEPVALYCEMDGRFPNHHPDPTVLENVRELAERVRAEKADVGLAYDGDGDRLGVVDENGEVIWGDRLLVLYARDLLEKHPGASVIGEVKCSQVLFDDVAKHGGKPILWKTGHSLIKAKMREEGVLLAGEMSGHLFFADRNAGYDDGIYASLRLLEILSRGETPLSKRLADLPKTHTTPEIRVKCPDDVKFEVVRRVKERFAKTHRVIDVDGARIVFDGGWGLVRASNTGPVLVLRFEAGDEKRLGEIRAEVEAAVAEARG